MDLLGDIGQHDQLTSARGENKILKEKCKELSSKVRILTIENESLKAELEIYRMDAVASEVGSLSIAVSNKTSTNKNTSTASDDSHDIDEEPFMISGNGVHVVDCSNNYRNSNSSSNSSNNSHSEDTTITLRNLHENANLLSCSLSSDDVYLSTGGADSCIRITQWGAALMNKQTEDSCSITKYHSDSVRCNAPVIATAFAPPTSSSFLSPNLVAGGCMDGRVHLVSFCSTSSPSDGTSSHVRCRVASRPISDHSKYVKNVCWSPTSASSPLLATSSADGTIHLYRISEAQKTRNSKQNSTGVDDDDIYMSTSNDQDDDDFFISRWYEPTIVRSFQLDGPVECMTFTGDGTTLICHARGTPHLSLFDLTEDGRCKHNKCNLMTITSDNSGGNNKRNIVAAGAGAFPDHVSFTAMDVCCMPSMNSGNNVVAIATDASRNIVLDLRTSGKQVVRNLYGHMNDSYSQPKIAYSSNGQYLYGNTQQSNTVCVWDIATAKIVHELNHGRTTGGHSSSVAGSSGTVRDLYSSASSAMLVTTSFDKQTKLWFAPQ